MKRRKASNPPSLPFSPELFRSEDVCPVLGAAWVWLVWRSQQHGEGPVHGGLVPRAHEETGEAQPVPGHEPGAKQLPQRQELRVGLHPLPWWEIHFLFILLKLHIMCRKCDDSRGCFYVLTATSYVKTMFFIEGSCFSTHMQLIPPRWLHATRSTTSWKLIIHSLQVVIRELVGYSKTLGCIVFKTVPRIHYVYAS